MTGRRDQLLGRIDFGRSVGVEIGALHSPVVERREGRILYVDYAETAVLRERLAHEGVDPSQVLDVDIVWGQGASLAETIGAPVDYAVASHVIEHVPDFVGWLSEIRAALKLGGVLGLAIPDRRASFDSYRNDTVVSEVLDAFIERRQRPSARQIIEAGAFARDDMAWPDWRPNGAACLPPSALARLPGLFDWVRRAVVPEQSYIDVHCWVFTPASFLALAEALARMALFAFAVEAFFPTQPGEMEFLVRLRAVETGDPAILTSMEQARAALGEIAPASRVAAPEQELAAMRASTSWRVTAPLRALVRRFRHVKP